MKISERIGKIGKSCKKSGGPNLWIINYFRIFKEKVFLTWIAKCQDLYKAEPFRRTDLPVDREERGKNRLKPKNRLHSKKNWRHFFYCLRLTSFCSSSRRRLGLADWWKPVESVSRQIN
jgi:hypothetical protein